jgi:hypothetical protein
VPRRTDDNFMPSDELALLAHKNDILSIFILDESYE